MRSESGKGSAFSLLLPPSRTGVESQFLRSEETPARPPQIGKPHVLLVEDDKAVRDATGVLLKVDGYRVTAVASLAEALQNTGDHHACVDLLLSDYHLSEGETGLQIIARLRERLGVSLKAVLITGDTSSAIRDRPLDPCLRITSKPVRAEELLTLLRALLAV